MPNIKQINNVLLDIHNIFTDRNDTMKDIVDKYTKDYDCIIDGEINKGTQVDTYA